MDGLAFYWNPKSTPFASYEEVVRLHKFQSEIATKTKTPDGYNYSNITNTFVKTLLHRYFQCLVQFLQQRSFDITKIQNRMGRTLQSPKYNLT
jgi:hypothetical protein